MSIVALDKTGTITKGQPKVTDLVPAAGVTERTLLQLAYDLEQNPNIPLPKPLWKKPFPGSLPQKPSMTFPSSPAMA